MVTVLSPVRSRPASPSLIGSSAALSRVRTLLTRVAPSRVAVLIHGESGTGKEAAARILHDRSPRAGRPFVSVNCSALGGGVLESELFGHTAGAFTGAQRDRRGYIEAADGGTLFLDEIGDAPPEFQARLLRVLQEREVVPVGSTEPRRVDVRVVAATHRDLEARIASGDFRADLYYRLRGLVVALPPLRERTEDLPELAAYLLEKLADGGPVGRLTEEGLAALAREAFPGNVRELEQRLAVAQALMGDGGCIGPAELRLRPVAPLDSPAPVLAAGNDVPGADAPAACWDRILDDILKLGEKPGWERIKASIIAAAQRRHAGNLTAAARELGIHRHTARRNQPRD